jgi:hypothetical protein
MNEQLFQQLEERVSRLEKDLQEIKARQVEKNRRAFEALAGIHEGDKVFEQIVREGRKIREADRKAARRADELADRKEKAARQARQKSRRSGKLR